MTPLEARATAEGIARSTQTAAVASACSTCLNFCALKSCTYPWPVLWLSSTNSPLPPPVSVVFKRYF